MPAYYNEVDPGAVAWLRELISAGHIAYGVVDDRSIVDVTAADLKGFTQCHFFAGIGGWSRALRLAGVPDNLPLFTGSCPCQSFSTAGQQKGFKDDRHLWPHMYRLIKKCSPELVFGEQVASKAGEVWLDLVCDDLESSDYTVGTVVTPGCSVGAPHLRRRVYWVAEATGKRRAEQRVQLWKGEEEYPQTTRSSATHPLARPCDQGPQGRIPRRPDSGRYLLDGHAGRGNPASGVANPDGSGQPGQRELGRPSHSAPTGHGEERRTLDARGVDNCSSTHHMGWERVDWLGCKDGKYRPAQPETQPLAHGVSHRVVKLRGIGNAIVVPQAQAFIEAYFEVAQGL